MRYNEEYYTVLRENYKHWIDIYIWIIITISYASNILDPYTFNTITNSIITPNRSCNISACRSIVAYNILHNFLYNTTIFAECTGCSYANWPNFPADWSNRWNIQNFYITSSSGQDCQGNPRTGDLTQCQYWCLQDVTCVGFSRQKSVPDTYSNTQCYLKNNIQLNRVPNDNTWHTIAFNDTL